ncbi:hypothetical protein ACW4TU_45615 (plasmid) [Streptomyces sp. QTS52]
MKKRSILTTAVLAVGMAILTAVPAHAGVEDGTLNNAHILSDIAALNTAINSDMQSTENNNANTRADGKGNSSFSQHE